MARKRFTAEQIIPKLREAEVELARGRTVAISSQFSVLALGDVVPPVVGAACGFDIFAGSLGGSTEGRGAG